MTTQGPSLGDQNQEEVARLIETLFRTGKRLEEVTAGQVDTVVDPDGRTFFLRGTQEQLVHSEAIRQASVLNALPAHIALLDPSGAIVSVNDAWRQFDSGHVMQGRPGYEVGRDYIRICADAQGEGSSEAHDVARGIQFVLEGAEKAFTTEYACHSPEDQRWFRVTVTPLADGGLKGAIVMHMDVTEQKQLALQLRRDVARREQAEAVALLLTERLSLATAVAKIGVWEWDLASNVGTWDATMLEMYGFPPTFAMSYQKWASAVLDGDRDQVEAALQKVIEEKGQASLEFRITRTDGSLRNISGACQTVCEGANVTRVIGVNIDVTERKEAEKALEQHRQDQLRFKDEFLSHVSHEIRSPLTAIMQFTSIILDGLAGEITEEQREYEQIVLRNAQQLKSMVDDLLEVTRLENAKLSVEPETLSIADCVADTLNTLNGNAVAAGVNLSSHLPSGLPVAYADPTRVRQILIILVDNAIKFTPSGGSVTVQIRPPGRDPDFISIDVSDTGSGIAPENVDRIFERLYQTSHDCQVNRKGLGLGLFICKELVTRQGGIISVESKLAKGSIFSFTLPVFSLKKLLLPLMKNDKWPVESAALVTVNISLGAPWVSRDSHEKWFQEVCGLLRGCVLPNLDILLPKMTRSSQEERFFVFAFADEKGATVLANRIREQFERAPHLTGAIQRVAVSHVMVDLFADPERRCAEETVTTLVANLQETIRSQATLVRAQNA